MVDKRRTRDREPRALRLAEHDVVVSGAMDGDYTQDRGGVRRRQDREPVRARLAADAAEALDRRRGEPARELLLELAEQVDREAAGRLRSAPT